jgi:hypothetical protein
MSMTVEAAAEVMRESMRETVKRHSTWYLVQSALMVLAGVARTLIFPGHIIGGARILSWLALDYQRCSASH